MAPSSITARLTFVFGGLTAFISLDTLKIRVFVILEFRVCKSLVIELIIIAKQGYEEELQWRKRKDQQ